MSAVFEGQRIVAALVQRGHLPADATPPPEPPVSRPWFVSLLLGVAGWLAGIFGMVFVFMVFEPRTSASLSVIGLVLLGAAFALYTIDRDNAFFDQLALALSIAGQIAIAGAIGEGTKWELAPTAALIAVLQVILVLVMPNPLARFLSALFACIAWAFAVRAAWWGEDPVGSQRAKVPLIPALLSWLASWLPIAAVAAVLIWREAAWMARPVRSVLRPMLSGFLVALAFGSFAIAPWDVLEGPPGESRVSWLVTWPLLSVAASMLAAFWAYRLRHAALVGAAAVAAFLHVVMFYYMLGTTLLMKSCIMAVVGILLVAAGALLRKAPARHGRETA